MNPTPPPLADYVADRDREQIRMLAIFYFVLGGLALSGIGGVRLHYIAMHSMFQIIDGVNRQGQAPSAGFPGKEFLNNAIWVYGVIVVILLLTCVVNILAGIFLLKKKNKAFSLLVAGFNCLQLPLGTVLGVFTIIVLTRPSVTCLYGSEATRS